MARKSEWEEIGGMTDNIWNYKDGKEGDEFVGVYKRTRDNIGENNSKLHIFEGTDGKEWGVWGCQILNDRFSSLFVGEEVKVLYLGKVQGKKKPYHDFKVFKKKYTEKVKKDYGDTKAKFTPDPTV